MKSCLYIIAGLMMTVTHSYADIRVLFGFDENGIRVHRVMHSTSRNFSVRDEVLSQSGDATIYWLDEAGVELAISRFADPRLSYAPVTVGSGRHITAVVHEGAWLVAGPDGARSATLLLPAHNNAGLGEILWTVLLPDLQ